MVPFVSHATFHSILLSWGVILYSPLRSRSISHTLLYPLLLHNEYLLLNKHALNLYQNRSQKTAFTVELNFFIKAA